MYAFHIIVDKLINRGVNKYPQVINRLWISYKWFLFFHMLKHKYDIKKKSLMQWLYRHLSTKSPPCRQYLSTPQYFVIILSISVVNKKMQKKSINKCLWVIYCKRKLTDWSCFTYNYLDCLLDMF